MIPSSNRDNPIEGCRNHPCRRAHGRGIGTRTGAEGLPISFVWVFRPESRITPGRPDRQAIRSPASLLRSGMAGAAGNLSTIAGQGGQSARSGRRAAPSPPGGAGAVFARRLGGNLHPSFQAEDFVASSNRLRLLARSSTGSPLPSPRGSLGPPRFPPHGAGQDNCLRRLSGEALSQSKSKSRSRSTSRPDTVRPPARTPELCPDWSPSSRAVPDRCSRWDESLRPLRCQGRSLTCLCGGGRARVR